MARIGVDAHVLTGKHQGSRTYLERLLRELAPADPANTYVLYSFDAAVTRALLPHPALEHRTLPFRASVPRLLAYWPCARRAHRLDLLVTTYVAPPLYRGPQLLVVHDLLFESHPELFGAAFRRRTSMLVRRGVRRASMLVTISAYTRDALVARYGVPPDRVALTYCGHDVDAPPDGGEAAADGPATHLRAGERYILYVGRLEPRKRVGVLVEAYRRLRAPGVRLVVVGREDFAVSGVVAALRETPGALHLRDVSAAGLDAWYRGAAAFVYPSVAEGFGLPVLEALARGVPVITSPFTALPEVGGPFARYVDPDAPGAADTLAGELAAVLAGSARPRGDALAGHLARFSWRRAAETFREAAERALAAPDRPRAALT